MAQIGLLLLAVFVAGCLVGYVAATTGARSRFFDAVASWYVLNVRERELALAVQGWLGFPVIEPASLGCAMAALAAAASGPTALRRLALTA